MDYHIPIGDLPDSEIEKGIDAAVQKLIDALSQKMDRRFKITVLDIHLTREVAKDNKTVLLMSVAKEIRLRNGYFSGANVRLAWKRNRKSTVTLRVRAGTLFEKYLAYGAVIAAAVITFLLLVFSPRFHVIGRVVVFCLFATLLIPCLIPYFVFRFFTRLSNDGLIEEIGALIRDALD